MELVPIQNQVPKGANDFAQGLVAVVQVVQKQLADGWQPTQDIPAIALEVFKDFPKVIAGLSELKADVDYDKGKVLLAVVNALDAVL